MHYLALAFSYVMLAFFVFGLGVGFPCFFGFPSSCFWFGVEPLVGRPSLGLPFGDDCFFAPRAFIPVALLFLWGGLLGVMHVWVWFCFWLSLG